MEDWLEHPQVKEDERGLAGTPVQAVWVGPSGNNATLLPLTPQSAHKVVGLRELFQFSITQHTPTPVPRRWTNEQSNVALSGIYQAAWKFHLQFQMTSQREAHLQENITGFCCPCIALTCWDNWLIISRVPTAFPFPMLNCKYEPVPVVNLMRVVREDKSERSSSKPQDATVPPCMHNPAALEIVYL